MSGDNTRPTLIFVSRDNFIQNYYDDFLIEKFKREYKVDLWSLSSIKGKKNTFSDLYPEVFVPKDYNSIYEKLHLIKGKKVIISRVYDFNLLRILNKKEILSIYVFPESLESLYNKKKLTKKIKENLMSIIMYFFNAKFTFSLSNLKKSHYFSKKTIKVSHMFHEQIIDFENKDDFLINENYGLFIDQFIPFHPNRNMPANINPLKYYNQINYLFELLEKTTKSRIKIALHPRNDLNNGGFDKRDTYKYETVRLIKHSRFVIFHDSLSIIYAIFYKKPMLFITTQDMKDSSKYKFDIINQEKLASYFNLNLLLLDNTDFSKLDIVNMISNNFDFNHELFIDYKFTDAVKEIVNKL